MSPAEGTIPSDPSARPRTPWFALVAPAVAWSAHELVSAWADVELCEHGEAKVGRAVLVLITIAALGVTVTGGVLGYRSFRRITGGAGVTDDEGRERSEMLALVSVLLAVVLTLAVVWGGLSPLLVADICGAKR